MAGLGGRNTYTARAILHHENERRIARYVRRCALVVERAEADAVFFKAVRQRPLLRQLEPRGYEQPDLLGDGSREDRRRRGARERKGRQGRGLEWRCGSMRGGIDAVWHVIC